MSEDFDDVANLGGSGKPTIDQTITMRNYLISRNRPHSLSELTTALLAAGFEIHKSSVGRYLRERGIGKPAPEKGSKVGELNARKRDRKEILRKEKSPPVPAIKAEEIKKSSDFVATMQALLADENTSTMLAINGNRHLMALNIVVAKMMTENAHLLLLDMRGTAAIMDSMTSAVKLSGGHAIDISIPTAAEQKNAALGISPEGHAMKDITPAPPKSTMASDLQAFRARKRAEDAQRA